MEAWNWIQGNYSILVPWGVPFLFATLNWYMKDQYGVLNLHLMGSDMGGTACSLFIGAVIGAIARSSSVNGAALITAGFLAIALAISWAFTMALGTKRFSLFKGSALQPVAAFLLGSMSFYCSVIWTLHVAKTGLGI